ncbi:MAG: YqaA family protein [Bdellovibrionales bacterium]
MKISDKVHEIVQRQVKSLQRFVDRPWYPGLVALIAFVDNFVLIIPTDGILISSSMLAPKRWLSMGVLVAIGSTLGAVVLALLVHEHGLPWILHFAPGLNQTTTWIMTDRFFDQYGLVLVFLIAISPIMNQPVVILAAMADVPVLEISAVVMVGRIIKFLVVAWVGSHAPSLLTRMWGLKGEMREAGVKLPPKV